ncbi:hypothetical protein HY636_00455 [Candidatus Woesearchaeota archaeon]|nr:hypothetical protein [Candidatus Woesearchaeota archaeon]
MVCLDNKFDENILQKYRILLFPQIAIGAITGYNVYADRVTSNSPIIVNYLHSNLGLNDDGTPHRHRKELMERLSELAQLKVQERVVNSVVDRVAVYKIGDWKENPLGLVFYDIKGNAIAIEDLEDYEDILIAEGKQFDLRLEIEDSNLLKKVLALFNKYTYAHKVNSFGLVKEITNPDAIFDAWEIPLIVVTSNEDLRRKDFRRIFDITITDYLYEISSLVRQQRNTFEDYLKEKGVEFKRIKRYANRSFVELYLDEL